MRSPKRITLKRQVSIKIGGSKAIYKAHDDSVHYCGSVYQGIQSAPPFIKYPMYKAVDQAMKQVK